MIFGYIASLFICNADIPFFVLAINAGLWCYLLIIRPECSCLRPERTSLNARCATRSQALHRLSEGSATCRLRMSADLHVNHCGAVFFPDGSFLAPRHFRVCASPLAKIIGMIVAARGRARRDEVTRSKKCGAFSFLQSCVGSERPCAEAERFTRPWAARPWSGRRPNRATP